MIARLIAENLRRPTGLPGRIVGSLMARGNRTEQGWTTSLLEIQPHDRVLEVGFGPGVAIEYAAKEAAQGWVGGIDCSETMVKAARKRNAAALQAGRVELRQGEVSSLPFPDASFDKAFTVHCLYFWDRPMDGLKELRRVLKPGGMLAVTIMPREKWPRQRPVPPDLFTLYSSAEVVSLLSEAGFRDARVEKSPQPEGFSGECVLGVSDAAPQHREEAPFLRGPLRCHWFQDNSTG